MRAVEAPGGDELPIPVLGPRDVFGVLSMISRDPAPATVTATTDGALIAHLVVNHTTSRAALGRDEIGKIVRRRTTVGVGFDAAERAAIQGARLDTLKRRGFA